MLLILPNIAKEDLSYKVFIARHQLLFSSVKWGVSWYLRLCKSILFGWFRFFALSMALLQLLK